MPSIPTITARSTSSRYRVLVLLCLSPAWALAQVVWDNGGGDNRWGTANNWSTNSVPTSASNVQINATDDNATVSNIQLRADRVANSLTFNNVNDNFSIINGTGSRTLRLTSRTITRTAGSSGNQTLAFTTLAPQNNWDAGWTWNISGSGSLTISANITGGWANNVKSGDGTLVLSGNNTFSGVTNINAGVLVAASNTALGSSTYGNTIASGAALHLQNNITLAEQQFQVTGTGVGGTGAIRNVSGSNTLAAAVDLTGNTSFTSAAGTLDLTGQVNLGSNTLTTGGAGNLTVSGSITNTGGIIKTDAGTLTLSGTGANSFGGTLSLNDGTVVLAKTAGTNAIGGGAVNIGDGAGGAGSAVLRLDASNQIADYSGTVTINSDGVLNVNNFTEGINTLAGTGRIDLGATGQLTVGVNSGSSTFGGTVLGSGTLIKAGSGSLTLAATLAITGELQLNSGTIFLSGYNLSAGTLRITGNSTIDFGGGNSTLTATNFIIDAGVTLTVANWANAADFFYAQNWAGAVFDASGSAPMNQVVFASFTANDTRWQSYDSQITPVPESTLYGAIILALATGLIIWHRQRIRQRPV